MKKVFTLMLAAMVIFGFGYVIDGNQDTQELAYDPNDPGGGK